jgi:hypothetical protein
MLTCKYDVTITRLFKEVPVKKVKHLRHEIKAFPEQNTKKVVTGDRR